MTSNEIKFLNYLDQAVNWEKEKQKVLSNLHPPFNSELIVKTMLDFEAEHLTTITDCLERMKALKVFNNTCSRRLFLSLVRENFDNIDFSTLKTNQAYAKIKAEILSTTPELQFVDDDRFLRQIGNAFAHGNYCSMLDIERLEKIWTCNENIDITHLTKGESNVFNLQFSPDYKLDPNYGTKANMLQKKIYEALKSPDKVSPLQVLLSLFYNTHDSAINIENLKFKYESSRMIDTDGNIVSRPVPKIFELEINSKQLHDLVLLLVAEQTPLMILQQGNQQAKQITLPEGISNEDVAKLLLKINDFSIFNKATNIQTPITFDKNQQTIFINEYVDTRKWFGPEFFASLPPKLADIIATNQNSHLSSLIDFYSHSVYDVAAACEMANNSRNVIRTCEYKLLSSQNKCFDLNDLIINYAEYIGTLKQVFNSYTEALITETQLLLQIMEDNSLFTNCNNNQPLIDIINCIDPNEMAKLRSSTKYKGDVRTVLYHLRDSLSHLLYLNNLNKELFIYDYTSKNNKTPDFKFTISIENLEKIKNELLNIVTQHIKSTQISNNNSNDTPNINTTSSSQDLSNNQ